MQDSMQDTKAVLDGVLEELHVQPVGWGYIDYICPESNVSALVC
jgi:hypothetical protein